MAPARDLPVESFRMPLRMFATLLVEDARPGQSWPRCAPWRGAPAMARSRRNRALGATTYVPAEPLGAGVGFRDFGDDDVEGSEFARAVEDLALDVEGPRCGVARSEAGGEDGLRLVLQTRSGQTRQDHAAHHPRHGGHGLRAQDVAELGQRRGRVLG